MSFLNHIHHANNADMNSFLPITLGATRVGWLHHSLGTEVGKWPDVFAISEFSVTMLPKYRDFVSRSKMVKPVLRAFQAQGLVLGWRDEAYPVMKAWGDIPLMEIERAACPTLGIRSWGIHVNGYVWKNDELHMWVAKRAADKPTYPGMLDNIVAGGQPIGICVKANLAKESWEEAGISSELSSKAVSVGMISYVHQISTGLKPDQMFCYDLELPLDFTPRNIDSEVEEFKLWPVSRLAEIVRDTSKFKFNCNLVIIDFLIRHGILTPDNEPDYMTLCHNLRR